MSSGATSTPAWSVCDLPENFKPEGNQVTDNELADNTYDLVYLVAGFPSEAFGNCFEGNSPSAPTQPENRDGDAVRGCQAGSGWDLGGVVAEITPGPPDVDWKTVAAPGDQEDMPDAASAPAEPAKASELPPEVDLAEAEG